MDLTATIGIISGIGGIGWAVWTKGVNPLIKREKERKAIDRMKLADIHAELRFNGGGSIKDAIFDLKNTTKNIEFRLDGIEENQKMSMNLQNISYWVSDTDGRCIYASPALCKLMGRSESEIIGNNWMALLHKDDKDRVVEAWEFSVENKTPFDEIYTIKTGNNEWVKVWGVAFHKNVSTSTLGGTLGKLTPIEAPVKN